MFGAPYRLCFRKLDRPPMFRLAPRVFLERDDTPYGLHRV
jgi:hypothetical protein